MRIALYYPWVYLTSGAERTLAKLTGQSRHDWTIFTHRYDQENTFPELRSRQIVELGRVTVRRSPTRVLRAAAHILLNPPPLDGFDALVVLCEGLGDLVTFRNRGLPTLCICLTPLRVAFDDHYRQWWGRGRSWGERRLIGVGAAAFRVLDRLAWRRYDHVICISEEARRRAVNGGLFAESEIEVAPVGLGFEPDPTASSFGNYFLLPGRIMWTKNIELGIRAFRRLRGQLPQATDLRLVVAGTVDEKSRPYLESLRELAGDDPVEFCVHPSDEELEELYRRSYAVIFTAFNEDWGIVPLEAMAFGKPVIATNRGGPIETVQDGVTGFLEPPDPDRFAARMRELVETPELTKRLGAAGPRRVAGFTWKAFAERVDRAVQRISTGPPTAEARPPTSSHAATAESRS